MAVMRLFYNVLPYCQDIQTDIAGDDTMAYYRRIKELREDHDKTQRDLAAVLDMPQSQYWRYEQGYRDIPTDILIKLADYYGVTVDYILGRADIPD